MMDIMNTGYTALAFVAILFLALQVWWIGMTIRNGRNETVSMNQQKSDMMRNRLEKIFSKSN